MKGVILAAGKGTRLYPVTKVIAKPLLPLANRMTIEYAFDQLKESGITEVGVVVGANESEMKRALGTGADFGVELTYIIQPEAKGLAHAVSFAEEFVGGDDFVLYLGDAMYDRPLAEYVDKFRKSGCANLNLVKPVEDPRRFGVANVEGDRIVKLVEKPSHPESNLAMAGLYVFGPQIWRILPDLKPSARGEYEITDAIQTLVDQGETVLAGVYDGAWFDTGTLDSFLETSSHLVQGGDLIDLTARVSAHFGGHVVIGAGAEVTAERLEDVVVLPGAKVNVKGTVSHCLLGGEVSSDSDLQNQIRYGDLD
ncbi:MAG: sugar phosphate nucleotidyltransferase [bacterium]